MDHTPNDDVLAASIRKIEAALADTQDRWGRQIASNPRAIRELALLIADDDIVEPYVMGFLQYARDRDSRPSQGALDTLRDKNTHAGLHKRLREHIMYCAGISTQGTAYVPQAHPTVVNDIHAYHAGE